MLIYGGDGSDVIWANDCRNTIFGDRGDDRIIGGKKSDIITGGAGNDTMHGGGGADIFCFGGNWGCDEVEQLSDGEITLVIENGSLENWDAEKRLYTSGSNSIQVLGNAEVSLVFEADPSLPEGVFSPAASEKIFEDKNKGMLA
jgi:Ca2+-binding RTX toxin-like protein